MEQIAEHAIHIPRTVLYQGINFTLVIALLYWLTRQKAREYFYSRGELHVKAKEVAQMAYAQAQKKHEEVTKKLQALHANEEVTMKKAQDDALLLKSKLIKEVELLAKNIIEDAKKTSSYEFEKAKRDLKDEALEEALALARTDIQKNMKAEDQKNLQEQFVRHVESAQ